MTKMDDNGKLYGLVDGAQYPDSMATWVLEFSPEVRSLFEGLPEEEAGNAAPILFEIDNAKNDWVRQIDVMDRYRPCFTVVRSALSIDEFKLHLQRFLFVDIGEGMQVLLRWFDPRSLPSILEVWGKAARAELTRPMAMWMYRGGHPEWQRVEIDERASVVDAGEFPLSFSQQQLDELERHDEPHALMNEFSDLGLIDVSQSYATRYQDFLRRYNRAGEWGLTSRADRHAFCVASYQYGESFERHDEIRSTIRSSIASRTPLVQSFEMVPAYVWRELMRSLEKKALQEPEVGK
ncbi:DUF4123 domain-containing protein [Burkholderia ambifaria]|jgi:hypothetical protein|uniref:DUF4123 domain-containing protein n=1 Tax=Burkholderia ambifaria IOP40-10 TaxID=396596 RepID=B1FA85_9BURK|nr:DUF4123 domain-containing protein [Burkholderia ambifaria]EDT05540.1 conserved hypothetical protein [Burkholderia ambifaria IOP40-10]